MRGNDFVRTERLPRVYKGGEYLFLRYQRGHQRIGDAGHSEGYLASFLALRTHRGREGIIDSEGHLDGDKIFEMFVKSYGIKDKDQSERSQDN